MHEAMLWHSDTLLPCHCLDQHPSWESSLGCILHRGNAAITPVYAIQAMKSVQSCGGRRLAGDAVMAQRITSNAALFEVALHQLEQGRDGLE